VGLQESRRSKDVSCSKVLLLSHVDQFEVLLQSSNRSRSAIKTDLIVESPRTIVNGFLVIGKQAISNT
jgi:hypothetical protein